MGGDFSRRLFLSSLASSLGTPIFAEPLASSLRPVARPPKPLTPSDVANVPSLDKIIGDAALGGRVSFAVADTQTGALLESRSGHWTLPPASVAKAVTALYALDTLGEDYKFETQLLATGPVENGILNGDLVLSGGGDPLLQTNDLATLAAALKATGLREVRGKFLVWGRALAYQNRIDAGQPDHVGYDPAISGLNLNFNRVYFEWKPEGRGFSATLDARSDKYRPNVQTARMKIEDRDFPVYTYKSENGRDYWTVAKGALGNGGGRWLPMRKPDQYTAEILRSFVRSNGIVLPSPEIVSEKPEGRVIARNQSPKLVHIVQGMLKYSTNITAEALGLTATKIRGEDASSLRTSAAAMSRWVEQRFGVRGVGLIDHSGLGDQSRISASALMTVLVSARQNSVLAEVMKSVAMRNAQGGPDHEHPIKVKAKTGTLNFVSSLAGYATTDEGKEYAFCIFAADTERRAAIPKQDRERPPGARSWNRRAKRMQQQLIERWSVLYRST